MGENKCVQVMSSNKKKKIGIMMNNKQTMK